MFVTANQVFIAAAAMGIGGICGILFTFSAFIKRFFARRTLKAASDVAAFILFAALYVFFSYKLNFPSHRLYMTAAALFGLFLYMKSFHIPLDFFAEKSYNKIRKKFAVLKGKEREKRRGRKIRKYKSAGNGTGSAI